MFWFFDFFFSDSLHVARTRGGKLTFVSTRTANAICSIPSRDRVSISKGGGRARPEYHPAHRGRHSSAWWGPAMHPDTGATRLVPGPSRTAERLKHCCSSLFSDICCDAKRTQRRTNHLFLKSNWSFKGVHTSLIEPVNIYFFKYIYFLCKH